MRLQLLNRRAIPNQVVLGVAVLLFLWTGSISGGDGLLPPNETQMVDLERVDFEQRLGEQVPLDLVFKNEEGEEVTLADCVNGKPTILVLAYYRCPQLCSLVLNDTMVALRQIPFSINKEFNVITVSFDPKEQPALAKEKKKNYIQEYGRDGAEQGWHFLTGKKPSIEALTQACGFKYFFDRMLKEYKHASGIMVLTPDGKLSRYLYGLKYDPADIRKALIEASDGKIGSFVEKLLMTCWSYDPIHKKYTYNVMMILRASGAVTLAVIGVSYLIVWRRGRRRRAQRQQQEMLASGSIS